MTSVPTPRPVIAVVNLKGGTGKTTTAVYVAHALHELQRRVCLVDADPQGSALGWNEDAPDPLPFEVRGMATTRLHQQLQDHLAADVDAVVIDTPPLEEKAGIVASALRVATVVIVPMAPTPIEFKRLPDVIRAVEDSAPLRVTGESPPLAVLLSRTHASASSTEVYREQVDKLGVWVLKGDVRKLERYAQAYGDNITDALRTSYGDAVQEMIMTGVVQ